MRKWQRQPYQEVKNTADIPPMSPIPAPALIIEEEFKPVHSFFECVLCPKKAEVLNDGTSYCRSCLQEKLRRGR